MTQGLSGCGVRSSVVATRGLTCPLAHGILVPEIKSTPHAFAWQVLNHWIPREVLNPIIWRGHPSGTSGKEPACPCRRRRVRFLGREDPWEEEIATHSSILVWGILMDQGA